MFTFCYLYIFPVINFFLHAFYSSQISTQAQNFLSNIFKCMFFSANLCVRCLMQSELILNLQHTKGHISVQYINKLLYPRLTANLHNNIDLPVFISVLHVVDKGWLFQSNYQLTRLEKITLLTPLQLSRIKPA